ncbi:hypothetical protein FTUN_4120 [Frigoriglobus tundricola]|uniref:Uncharacterized protein n=1 Tax=Frigoriglobus tundricola TaxID=2774151 RepID=A0A6M5YTB0_9BACT|nr:hypothetical protein FTUN_4120 [Frigoriglobus tundricola]
MGGWQPARLCRLGPGSRLGAATYLETEWSVVSSEILRALVRADGSRFARDEKGAPRERMFETGREHPTRHWGPRVGVDFGTGFRNSRRGHSSRNVRRPPPGPTPHR